MARFGAVSWRTVCARGVIAGCSCLRCAFREHAEPRMQACQPAPSIAAVGDGVDIRQQEHKTDLCVPSHVRPTLNNWCSV